MIYATQAQILFVLDVLIICKIALIRRLQVNYPLKDRTNEAGPAIDAVFPQLGEMVTWFPLLTRSYNSYEIIL